MAKKRKNFVKKAERKEGDFSQNNGFIAAGKNVL